MKRKVFYRSNVDRVKKEVKTFLDAYASDQRKKLAFIQKMLSETKNDESSEARLRSYVLIMSALVHHQRFGGLTSGHIKRLTEFAEAILMAENIVPGESRLSFLYVELYAVLSQIERNEGNHWSSTWNLLSSFHFQYRPIDDEKAWNELGTAIRLLRLGFSHDALLKFRLAESQLQGHKPKFQSQVGQIICHRMLGEYEQSREITHQVMQHIENFPFSYELDLQWESAMLETFEDGDPGRLFKLVMKRKDSHSSPNYKLEAYVWSKIARPFEQSHVSKPTSVAKKTKIESSTIKNFYQATLLLEKALDKGCPLLTRPMLCRRPQNTVRVCPPFDTIIIACVSRSTE